MASKNPYCFEDQHCVCATCAEHCNRCSSEDLGTCGHQTCPSYTNLPWMKYSNMECYENSRVPKAMYEKEAALKNGEV